MPMQKKPLTRAQFLAALRRLVKAHGSERAAAKILEVSHVSVHLWLKGEQNPAPLTIKALASVLEK